MEKYRYLKEHFFDETASKRLSQYADTGKADIKAGEFMLQGEVHALPYTPVPSQFKEHFLYLQQYAVMDMCSTFYTHRKNYDSYLVLLTLSGNGHLIYRGEEYTLGTGDGFLIDCHEEHSYYTAGEHWKHMILHFNGRDASFYYTAYFSEGSPLFHFSNSAHCENLLEKILESVCSIKDNREFNTSICIQTLIFQLAEHRRNAKAPNETADTIRYLCKYMENHYAENLTLTDLAAFSGFHPSYLCRVFKKETGYSPKEYITILRLEQAKGLLCSTSLPVYKIGIMVGIPDETNFTRLFKKYEHNTPGEYREKTQ